MMNMMSKTLKDDGARRDAISHHHRSILVEAGAGSGKTAVMAGRIADERNDRNTFDHDAALAKQDRLLRVRLVNALGEEGCRPPIGARRLFSDVCRDDAHEWEGAICGPRHESGPIPAVRMCAAP